MTPTPAPDVPPPGFPFATVAATAITLFLFVGLALWAIDGAAGPTDGADSRPDPYTKRGEVEARNRAVLEGRELGTRPMAEALPEYAARVKAGAFPFPTPPSKR